MARGSVCILSQQEVAALSIYDVIPNHNHHKHATREDAVAMVAADYACTVGEAQGLNAIVEHASNNYVWKSRMSKGHNVRQMVRLVQG